MVFAVCLLLLTTLLIVTTSGQETTAGLQGTIKDPTGAVVPGAQITVTSPSLVGTKQTATDGKGYYRFANLPPGTYTMTVTAKGFATIKREGMVLEVGHLPTLDLAVEVGAAGTVIEVSAEAPLIDVTTQTTQSNITQDVIQDVPHGRSFQSVIQFAPSARNEPLEGSTSTNGTGGNAPGSTTNGSDHGFSVAGGSDAENSYLVEGQQTANLIGGYSHTNVPFDFIQEVQIKSSGIEAEHGGALGGVVNVVMKKGSNTWHGSVFAQFENDGLDGSPVAYARYDPLGGVSQAPNTPFGAVDATYQEYQPKKPHTSDVFPGFTIGGPLLKDRLFFFAGFNPEWVNQERTVDFSGQGLGLQKFSRNQQTYYTTARIDASVTQKIRVYASWLYQYQRETGQNLPASDSTIGLFNVDASNPVFVYSHDIGYSAPNNTTNVGADFTISPHLVATTRFGYYFENYHDFGYPTDGTINNFQTSGTAGSPGAVVATAACFSDPTQCQPLPSSLQQANGYFNAANSGNATARNANKAIQFDADLAWYKTGWKGTHNFKFGYQLNRLSNDISQHYNEPYVQYFVGTSAPYAPSSALGIQNCNNLPLNSTWGCQGQYGTIIVQDFGTTGKVTSFNHGLFAQDAWTIGHGITINAGLRFDKEYLPGSSHAGLSTNPINFGWGDKVAPRVGAAWDVFQNGKMKVFGSYGAFYDIMKLNLAISSFGGQYWNNCVYALDTSDVTSIVPSFDSNSRFCAGDVSTGANWKAGSAPSGLTFIENINFRTFPTTCSTCSTTSTGVAPGLKPFEQHESVFGVEYQVFRNAAFSVRWDRRRLDHVIEDSSIIAQNGPAAGSETFVITNPGQGVYSSFNSFYNFLYGTPPPPCSGSACPVQGVIPGARSYDGVEFRLTKASSSHWFGMFSYTYSHLRGNYTGLTSSDVSDGGNGGRSAPNNSRAFDEPYFSWNSDGGSSSGLLPTDRTSTFKGYAYYELPWLKKFSTDFGLFQYVYSGSPVTSYVDVGLGAGGWPVQIHDRGKWVDATQDPSTGLITIGNPRTFRTPWYSQSDFSLQQNYTISEAKALSFNAIFTNLFNQRAVTAYNSILDTLAGPDQFVAPPSASCGALGVPYCFIGDGNAFYAAAERPYSIQNGMNNFLGSGQPIALNSQYGKPQYYQHSRNIRLGVKFTF
jgi:outer membrane receptor protein involved in Fe transport